MELYGIMRRDIPEDEDDQLSHCVLLLFLFGIVMRG